MYIEHLLHILQTRHRLMLKVFAAVMLLALAIALFWPSQWSADSVMVVNEKANDPLTGMPVAAYLIPGYLDTQADIITSHNTALKVVDALGLDKLPDAQQGFIDDTGGVGTVRDWLADQLLKKLTVKPGRDSSLIALSYSANDPKFAAAVANAFAHAYMAIQVDIETSAAQQQNLIFQQQLAPLRDNLAKASQQLAAFQKEAGVLYDDSQHVDLAMQRLNSLGNQLVNAKSQTADARARAAGNDLAPDVQNSPVVQAQQTQLAAAEIKLKSVSEKYGVNHPVYREALAARDANMRQLALLEGRYVSSLKQGAANSMTRQSDLQRDLSEEQNAVLSRKEKSAQLNALEKEVEDAQRAYSQVLQRASDTSLASHASAANVFVLKPALTPTKPSFPRPLLTLAAGVLVGLAMAVLAALLAETFDRRVHVEEDLSVLEGLPVLARIEYTEWRKANRFDRLLSRMKLTRKVQTS